MTEKRAAAAGGQRLTPISGSTFLTGVLLHLKMVWKQRINKFFVVFSWGLSSGEQVWLGIKNGRENGDVPL